MELIQAIMTKNECYLAGRSIAVRGLMLHSIGAPQPSAEKLAKSYNVARPNGAQVAVHAFLQADGKVYQTLPWKHRGWHCGSGKNGSGNDHYVGIEMTEPSTIAYTGGASWVDKNPVKTKEFVLGTYRTAVELFAFLCKEFALNPLEDGVIISHSEGYRKGIASNHGDVEHIWSKFGLSMDKFRQDVSKLLVKKEEKEGMTQEQFNEFARVFEDRINPFYKGLNDVPPMWVEEVNALIKSGAIRGDGVNELGIRHETLRAAIINKRYADSLKKA